MDTHLFTTRRSMILRIVKRDTTDGGSDSKCQPDPDEAGVLSDQNRDFKRSTRRGLQIEAWPQGHPGPGYSLGYEQDEQSIVGMLPDGNYTVQAKAIGPHIERGQINFNVKGGGPNGARFSLVPDGSIRVEVKQEFTTAEIASQIASMESYEVMEKLIPKSQYVLRNVHVSLNQVDDFPSVGGFGARPPGPTDNTLLIENVSPGQYVVQERSARIRGGSEFGWH